jgi:hypothetical protein
MWNLLRQAILVYQIAQMETLPLCYHHGSTDVSNAKYQ